MLLNPHISLPSNNRTREHGVSELSHTCYTHTKQSLSRHNNKKPLPMDLDRSQKTEDQILALADAMETGTMQHARAMLNELSPADIVGLFSFLGLATLFLL